MQITALGISEERTVCIYFRNGFGVADIGRKGLAVARWTIPPQPIARLRARRVEPWAGLVRRFGV